MPYTNGFKSRMIERMAGPERISATAVAFSRVVDDLGYVYTYGDAPYLGGLPLYSSIYGCTEAVIGVGPGPGRPVYVLTPGTACSMMASKANGAGTK